MGCAEQTISVFVSFKEAFGIQRWVVCLSEVSVHLPFNGQYLGSRRKPYWLFVRLTEDDCKKNKNTQLSFKDTIAAHRPGVLFPL